MKALCLKAPYQFKLIDVELREPREDEVRIEIMACGFCGHDNILAKYWARDWELFGHEFSGRIVARGSRARRFEIGDRVCIQTSTFNPYSPASLNGRVDLDESVIDYMAPAYEKQSMGFSEAVIVPECLCVPIGQLSYEEASFVEPLGVAADLIRTADIHLNDDVLFLGTGPIGLMALQMARKQGARRIYVAELSSAQARCEVARRYGADEIIYTDKEELTRERFPRGGVNRVLLTAPPKLIDLATQLSCPGGIVAFLGIAYGDGARATFDSNIVHLRKLQIRGSNAIPALYFPECIEMMEAGLVSVHELISHRFTLEHAVQALTAYASEPARALKAVMLHPSLMKDA